MNTINNQQDLQKRTASTTATSRESSVQRPTSPQQQQQQQSPPIPFPFTFFTEKRHETLSLPDPSHPSQIHPASDWRMRERLKTVSVALVLCLNIGIDPPDVIKTSPCAKLECWIDPFSMPPQKALETIGKNLQQQYEVWQPRARYRVSLDPSVEETKKLCCSLRRNAKEERILFHYNGHGVPRPTPGGEIWVFNKNYTQYIPVSVYDLQTWLGSPCIFVYDCSNAGNILLAFKKFAEQRDAEYEKHQQQLQAISADSSTADLTATGQSTTSLTASTASASSSTSSLAPVQKDGGANVIGGGPGGVPQRNYMEERMTTANKTAAPTTMQTAPPQQQQQQPQPQQQLPPQPSGAPPQPGAQIPNSSSMTLSSIPYTPFLECIQLAACGPNETLPMNPDLPADLFSCCLTTPIEIALRWFVSQNPLLSSNVTPEMIMKIPGRLNDRRTPLGELNWIFTAITDTIAWNVLPHDLFKKLFRQDLMVAALFRNFLLAERIMRFHNCTPMSNPPLPSTHQHPMWNAWDLAADMCLSQLPALIAAEEAKPGSASLEYKHSTFFAEQLTAFEVWLGKGYVTKKPPEQLPIVLQVLLSQVHRLRALMLLSRFLDLGPWAVNLALGVGIFPYVLKLLQSPAVELKPVLVFIWAKILAVDKSCQNDLMKDNGFAYFVSILVSDMGHVPIIPNLSEHRAMCAFILSRFVSNAFIPGKQACLKIGLCPALLVHMSDPDPLLRQWATLCLANWWESYPEGKMIAVREGWHIKIVEHILLDPVPEVRASGLFALATLLGDGGIMGGLTPSESVGGLNNSSNGSPNRLSKLSSGIQNASASGTGASKPDDIVAFDHTITMKALLCLSDASPIVRKELVIALSNIVADYESKVTAAAFECWDEERKRAIHTWDGSRMTGKSTSRPERGPVPASVTAAYFSSSVSSSVSNTGSSVASSLSSSPGGPMLQQQHQRGASSSAASRTGYHSNNNTVTKKDGKQLIEGFLKSTSLNSVYAVTWRALLVLSCDPVPEVAQLAGKIVDAINWKMIHSPLMENKIWMEAERERDRSERERDGGGVSTGYLGMMGSSTFSQQQQAPFPPGSPLRSDRGTPRPHSMVATTSLEELRSLVEEGTPASRLIPPLANQSSHIPPHPHPSLVASPSSSSPNTPKGKRHKSSVGSGVYNTLKRSASYAYSLKNLVTGGGSSSAGATGGSGKDGNTVSSVTTGSSSKTLTTNPADGGLTRNGISMDVLSQSLSNLSLSNIGKDDTIIPSTTEHRKTLRKRLRTEFFENYQTMSPQDHVESLTLPLTSSFYDWACESFAEPQMKIPDVEDPGSVEYNQREWRRIRNNRILTNCPFTDPVPDPNMERGRSVSVAPTLPAETGSFDDSSVTFLNDTTPVVHRLVFHAFDDTVVIADDKDSVHVWNWKLNTRLHSFSNANPALSKIGSIGFINEDDDGILYVGSDDGVLRLYRDYESMEDMEMISAWKVLPEVSPFMTKGSGMVVDWQQTWGTFLIGGESSVVNIWDVEREICVQSLPTQSEMALTYLVSEKEHPGCITTNIFDLNLVYAGFNDGAIHVLDRRCAPSASLVHKIIEERTCTLQSLQLYTPNTTTLPHLVSANSLGQVKLWDLRRLEQPGYTWNVLEGMSGSPVGKVVAMDIWQGGLVGWYVFRLFSFTFHFVHFINLLF